ncbi:MULTISPECIES: LytR/AlgR family response regulator transcription factor [Butyricimonas]|uniref:LytR/AlgR family response regulator transcription factor n=1 Tax=Butyricimonas TaxID=574697 RepID=UPI001D068AB0|nr:MULTISPECIES: LytTR family DNA-binding domain-containing protein [Butyricimonas]MCB6974065.1 LytTR family DNA-binding domain-containing protein [Butyricimonas synergistica]MCG4520873.1 LytTR family DNA-binding domain-containing protein [Butyricimonas sp. DFI.6.44]
MTLNCLIVDDEPLALELLESYVSRTPFLHLVDRCDSAIKALSVIEETPVDLIFLDIQMPELNGLELSRLVGNKVKIIFTTAFEQYAIEGFRVDALDYLLKPFNYSEFLRAATKALRTRPAPESIFVKSDYKLVQVQLKDILYIEGLKDYIRIQTEDGQGILTLMSMKSIEDFLPADTFVRVHRSYIINMNKIKTIERNRIIFGKVYIPISDSYKDRFTELLDKRAIN